MKQKPDEDHFSKRCQWFESCCEQRHTSTLISGLWSRLWLSVQLTECSHVDACKVETSWIYSSETYFWGCKHNFPSNKKPQQFKFPFDKFWVVDTAINSRHIFFKIPIEALVWTLNSQLQLPPLLLLNRLVRTYHEITPRLTVALLCVVSMATNWARPPIKTNLSCHLYT